MEKRNQRRSSSSQIASPHLVKRGMNSGWGAGMAESGWWVGLK